MIVLKRRVRQPRQEPMGVERADSATPGAGKGHLGFNAAVPEGTMTGEQPTGGRTFAEHSQFWWIPGGALRGQGTDRERARSVYIFQQRGGRLTAAIWLLGY